MQHRQVGLRHRVARTHRLPTLTRHAQGCFEWLGIDLVVDADWRVWLLEVNVSPDVSHATRVLATLVPAATAGLLDRACLRWPVGAFHSLEPRSGAASARATERRQQHAAAVVAARVSVGACGRRERCRASPRGARAAAR